MPTFYTKAIPESAVFFSDDMGYLADCLGRHLFSPPAKPFEKRLVIVPSSSTKTFIQRRFSEGEEWGIAAGVDIVDMPSALSMLAARAGKILPTSLELTLALVSSATDLIHRGDKIVDDLRSYIEGKENRLFPLCVQLANLFLDYGHYGEEYLNQWLDKGGWQTALWRAVFENSPWVYPLQLFSSSVTERPHLFGFMTLSSASARFFKRCSAFFYLFSPCMHYWGDFVGDEAHARKVIFLQQKGVAETQLSALEEYVEEQHPLLANWGQAGRYLLEVLATEEMVCEETFHEKRANSRLHHLQRSILNLESSPSNDVDGDNSLQIYSASSRSREVETLLDVLKGLMERHAADQEPLFPSDILVLAPDISVYFPFIQTYFGSDESQVNYIISGIERIRFSPLAEAFQQLLGLVEKKFDASALLALFRMPPFCNKQAWSESELAEITEWIDKAKITWGYDGANRAKIIHATAPLDERGSWSFGFDRLLFGLTCEENPLIPSPLPLLEWTDTDLFAQLVRITSDLARDLDFMAKEEKRSLSDWARLSGELIERYFLKGEEENWVYEALARLNQTCRFFDRSFLNFADFRLVVGDILYRCSGQTPSSDLQAVRFTALREGNVLPAKVICLLGMQEGAFPRRENISSLREIPLKGASQSAEDRYLFLEACIKAQSYLWISYLRESPEEKVELMPSIIVQELIHWMQSFFTLQEKPNSMITKIPFLRISKETLERFPVFSATRLKAAELYRNNLKSRTADHLSKRAQKELPPDAWPEIQEIRMEDLQECLRNPLSFYFSRNLHIRLKKERRKDFEKEEFTLSFKQLLLLSKESLTVPLHAVVAAAKRRGEFPIGEFEQVAFRTIEKKREEFLEQMELFSIKPEESFSVILSRFCDEPKLLKKNTWVLPAWQIALRPLHKSVSSEKGSHFDEVSVLSEPTYAGRLIEGERKSKDRKMDPFNEENQLCRGLQEKSPVFCVTGKIEDLSPQGLICYLDNKPSQLIADWPIYLLLRDHPQLQHIPPALIPVGKQTKSKEKVTWPLSDVKEEIGKLLLYYQKAEQSISPFLPEWIPDFFGPFEKIEKSLRAEKAGVYVKWLEEQGLPFVRNLLEIWRPYIDTTFQNFLGNFR